MLGVVGENGIGKTTFVKVLAGVEKADKETEIDTVPISYKPQSLDSESEELVMDVLREANEKYSNDLIGPLELKPLMLKKINELSGGELQRVAIAKALGKKAELILLDEPSAYLDVEQRLVVSKIIATFSAVRDKSILVVDHDLVFIDYISDRIMVFDGEPAVSGKAHSPDTMEKGMNHLLKEVDITLRREEITGRPRINKLDSVKDREQKTKGKYYYA
jgi:ATP-binding cassette subfamily E protein 1